MGLELDHEWLFLKQKYIGQTLREAQLLRGRGLTRSPAWLTIRPITTAFDFNKAEHTVVHCQTAVRAHFKCPQLALIANGILLHQDYECGYWSGLTVCDLYRDTLEWTRVTTPNAPHLPFVTYLQRLYKLWIDGYIHFRVRRVCGVPRVYVLPDDLITWCTTRELWLYHHKSEVF